MNSIFRKIRVTLVKALKQGWSPSAVCWSAAWGLTIGLFPIYGVTTAILGVMGVVWRLNHAVMQVFNYLVSPLKFILILPYVRLGEWMFRTNRPFRLSIPEFTAHFQAAPLETLREFAMTFLHAISGWAVSVPLWMAGSFFTTHLLLRMGSATREQLQEIPS